MSKSKNAWDTTSIKILKKNYRKYAERKVSKQTFVSLFNYKWSLEAIKAKAFKLNLNITKKWTKEEEGILIKHYYNMPEKELLKLLPSRTWEGITKRTSKDLKIKRDPIANTREYKLEKLLQETPEAYYWIGFILADGYITKDRQISIELSAKDENHLIKYKNFIQKKDHIKFKKMTNGKLRDMVVVTTSNSQIIPIIINKFDIDIHKTKYPPSNLNNIKNLDLMFSLIIGYIDGDGTISKSPYIAVDVHFPWINVHDLFYDSLKKIFPQCEHSPRPIINSKKLATLSVGRIPLLQAIKRKALELNLPIMKRKWDRIDLDRKTKKRKIF